MAECNNGTRLRAFATFLRAAINFHSARAIPFFSFLRTIEINCLTAREGGDISERNSSAEADTVAWFSEHVLCSFFFPFLPARRASLRRKRVFLARLPPTLFMIPCALPLHVTAPAAILRIAPSRKRILRPQLRVQAILLFKYSQSVGTCEPGERVSTK